MVVKGLGKGKWGVTANGCRTPWDDEYFLELDNGGNCTTLNTPEPLNYIL